MIRCDHETSPRGRLLPDGVSWASMGLVRIDRIADVDEDAIVAIEGPTQIGAEELRAERGRPWSHIWVAREDAEGPVGFVIIWHVVDEIHVLNLTTRVDRRRRGIARALMLEVLDHARSTGARLVLLEVRPSNEAALGLYRAVGFTTTGLRARYYADDEDAVEMSLTLDVRGDAAAVRAEARVDR